jgi:hypothetical protein
VTAPVPSWNSAAAPAASSAPSRRWGTTCSAAAGQRAAFLATARRRLAPHGQVLCQLHPADWFDTAAGLRTVVDGVGYHLHDITRVGNVLTATMTYRIDEREWHHPFTAERVDEGALSAAFADAGLRFDRWLDERHGWVAAR